MSEKIIGYVFHEAAMNEGEIRSMQRQRNGVVRMVAVLQEANLPNRNGRVYPKAVIEKALQAPFVKEKLGTNSLLGESNHPANADMQRQMSIDLNNVSHVIKKVWWDPQDSNLLLGEVETASTETGKNFAGLISENGMQASFSMRGLGDVVKAGGKVTVKDPLRIVTYDSVHFPSHQKAYMRNVVNESAVPVGIDALAKYAAENSKDFAQLNENVLCIAQDKLDFKLEEGGKLVIIDREIQRPAAVVLIESKLEKEVTSALRRLF
jgi:hypothetical protein